MTVKSSQKCPCVHIWVNSQNGQLTGFDPYSNFPLKCLNSKRVNVSKDTVLFTVLFMILGCLSLELFKKFKKTS